ncbi:hypothetical protein PPL_07563 [Heterostelium album PN500]|uniref:DUF1206 domain-containing protein n=1 Tax=Heterostelium pallidum (strain ATCC 26659 / Pp 5 / PN500) TaxID=670386 RepID=D3BGB2_HETP5|nr:hypothetical protein PPL_07563 [Heterostelium album PN500]EFA79512.1 hypothetical protein PPL_07563 [Heterostelium album PN500]|eukprot:XP_020431633.1 hypothetical protein PPL_07563 [Heterostelium album PN500]
MKDTEEPKETTENENSTLDKSDIIFTNPVSKGDLKSSSADSDESINNSGDDLIKNTEGSSTNVSPEFTKSTVSKTIITNGIDQSITVPTNSTSISPIINTTTADIINNNGVEIPIDNHMNGLQIANSNSNNNIINHTIIESQQSLHTDIKIQDNKLYNNVSIVTPISSPPVTQIELANTPKLSEISEDQETSDDKPKSIDIQTSEEDEKRAEQEAKERGKLHYFKYLFKKNKHRLDIKGNKRFYLAAQIITRIGFFSKFLMYVTLGCISIAAAVDKTRQPLGPAGAFEELQEMFSGGVSFLLIIGLWCYGTWGIFFVIFDIDQLGRKTAGAILKRFGRIFSSGFYFVLGVDAAQVLAHTRHGEDKSGTEQILIWLYASVAGKILVCVIGVVMFVVSIVYLVYFIKPDKFKKELSTERMTKGLFYTSLAFARIGAIGRSMFFAAFGSCLIKAVADLNKGRDADASLLGFQGVFRAIARFNSTLLFIIAALIVIYAFWCLWLVAFRRLPAHQDAQVAQTSLSSLGAGGMVSGNVSKSMSFGTGSSIKQGSNMVSCGGGRGGKSAGGGLLGGLLGGSGGGLLGGLLGGGGNGGGNTFLSGSNDAGFGCNCGC